jgi:hypothetical protein
LEDSFRLAEEYASKGQQDKAYALFNKALDKNFDNPKAIYALGKLYLEAEQYGLAYNLFRLSAGFGKSASAFNSMGLCHAETYDVDASLALFRKALQCDPNDIHALSNISLAHLLRCEPEKALAFGKLALKKDPEFEAAIHNVSYANLLLGNWKEGWDGHKRILGRVKTRAERFYENKGKILPKWDGSHGKTVLVYTEQGIGDEISFASCIPDLVKVSKKVVLDCNGRLEPLFEAAFPDVDVHGTRYGNPMDWVDNYDFDGTVAIGDLPSFFRNKTEDFPGTPYLKANPKKLEYPRPVIGIAWTGGAPNTGSIKRSLKLEDLESVFRACEATWVSLEYKDRNDEIQAFREKTGIEILQPEEAKSKNYQDTADLVAGLDLVISVTTAVIHLSGALGKECWCIAPNRPRWFYRLEGDLPWYKSVKLFRQDKGGEWPIGTIVKLLKLRYASGI